MRKSLLLATAVIFSSAVAVSSTSVVAQETTDDGGEATARLITDEIIVIGEPSTFGATKSEIPILETPRSVSVITADEFLDRGALTLDDTLNYTAGVVGNAFGFATRGDSTNIRGLDAPQYQDNLQVLFGTFNNARVDIYTIEQVEVLKGPASVLYGQAAPGGIVSTVSKRAGPENLGSEIVFNAGTFDRYQASADIGIDLTGDGRLTARVVGVFRDSETQVDFVTDDAVVIAPSITYDDGRTSLSLLFNFTDRNSDTSAQFLPLTATACGTDAITISDPNICATATGRQVPPSTYVGDPNFNRFDTQAATISVFAMHQFTDFLSFEGTARYRDNEADYDQAWFAFLADGVPRLQPDGTGILRSWFRSDAGSSQYAVDARLRAKFETSFISHEILGGVNYQDVDTFDSLSFLNLPTTFNIFDPVFDGSEIPSEAMFDALSGRLENQTIATDVYITDQMNIGNLIINAGIRYSSVRSEDDTTEQDDDQLPVTVGALYRTPIGLNPYFSYAESFRATVGTDLLRGTPLRPRKGAQLEAGLKYQPPGSASYLTVAFFDLEEDNLVEFIAGGQTQPGLTVETRGVEVEALVSVSDFAFDFDFRYLDAEDVDEEGVAVTRPSLPETIASLWTMWQPSEGRLSGFRLGAGFRYAGQNESNGTSLITGMPIRVVTDGYTVFDALVGYTFDNFDISLNGRNLGNKEYFSTCLARGDCFPAEVRTVVGTLRYRF
ncbi:MAG: TonB-dependent siderophore receptor [Pseudomonadota bacterium]